MWQLDPRRRDLVVPLLAATFGVSLLATLIKRLVSRVRPGGPMPGSSWGRPGSTTMPSRASRRAIRQRHGHVDFSGHRLPAGGNHLLGAGTGLCATFAICSTPTGPATACRNRIGVWCGSTHGLDDKSEHLNDSLSQVPSAKVNLKRIINHQPQGAFHAAAHVLSCRIHCLYRIAARIYGRPGSGG